MPKTATLQGHKERDVYTIVYKVKNTVFFKQTGHFPTQSQQGKKYIMVMVEIDSSAILVEPINNCKNEELTQAYRTMMLRLRSAGIIPKNHILDNEVSESLKTIIRNEYKIQIWLVPPRTHRINGAEVDIRNFKSHFLSGLAVTVQHFSPSLWDRLLP